MGVATPSPANPHHIKHNRNDVFSKILQLPGYAQVLLLWLLLSLASDAATINGSDSTSSASRHVRFLCCLFFL